MAHFPIKLEAKTIRTWQKKWTIKINAKKVWGKKRLPQLKAWAASLTRSTIGKLLNHQCWNMFTFLMSLQRVFLMLLPISSYVWPNTCIFVAWIVYQHSTPIILISVAKRRDLKGDYLQSLCYDHYTLVKWSVLWQTIWYHSILVK